MEHPYKELTTERCILKKPELENARDLFAIYGDEETMKYMQMPCVKSVEECTELLEKWMIFSHGVFPFAGVYS